MCDNSAKTLPSPDRFCTGKAFKTAVVRRRGIAAARHPRVTHRRALRPEAGAGPLGKEEECLALQADSTGSREALPACRQNHSPQGRLRLSEVVVEPVVGVECVIPQVVNAVPCHSLVPERLRGNCPPGLRPIRRKYVELWTRNPPGHPPRPNSASCQAPWMQASEPLADGASNNARLGSHICTDTDLLNNIRFGALAIYTELSAVSRNDFELRTVRTTTGS